MKVVYVDTDETITRSKTRKPFNYDNSSNLLFLSFLFVDCNWHREKARGDFCIPLTIDYLQLKIDKLR